MEDSVLGSDSGYAGGRRITSNIEKVSIEKGSVNVMNDTINTLKDETDKNKDVLILAIESSCDETAASVVKNGRVVLSNIISSQIDLHTLYGGVVPEIASRKHMEQVNQVTQQALKDAGVALEDITAVAVTYGRCLSEWLLQSHLRLPQINRLSEYIILRDI